MTDRDYSAGELIGRPTTVAEQLALSENFTKNGKLYLVRCAACGGKYGRENYLPAVADGVCAWCGWHVGRA